MSNHHHDVIAEALPRQEAPSRRRAGGGTGPEGDSPEPGLPAPRPDLPALGEPELQMLHVRVIALENLVIALLAETSERGRGRARSIASSLVPRPGFVRHPLTIHAAARMNDLIDRAVSSCRRRLS